MGKPNRLVVIGKDDTLRGAAEVVAEDRSLTLVAYREVSAFVDEDHAGGIGCILIALDGGDNDLTSIDAMSPYARRWPVIIGAQDATVATVVKAMKWGAFDFLTGFDEPEVLGASVKRALAEHRRSERARRRLERLQDRLGALSRPEAEVLQVAMASGVDPAPLRDARRPKHGRNVRARAVNGGQRRSRSGGRGGGSRVVSRVADVEDLTPRLRQTLEHLLQGDSEKQVASRMGLSRHTVHDYIKALHKHFGVRSRGELLAMCLTAKEAEAQSPRRIVC